MAKIMQELYYGRISPFEKHYEPDSEYMRLAKRQERSLDKFMSTLNEQEKEMFEEYCDAQGEIENFIDCDMFTYGLRFGVLLMAEAFMC